MPAVGFGLLLRVMFKAQYIPYPIAGFLFVCFQLITFLPVAVLGAGFAVYEFFNAKAKQQAQPQPVTNKNNEEEDYSNSEISKKTLLAPGFDHPFFRLALTMRGWREVLPGDALIPRKNL